MERMSFAPYVERLGELIEGGIPTGSWVMFYGDPGSYKTLHALAFALAGLRDGDKVVYLSTEQSWRSLKTQIGSLNWQYRAREGYLRVKTINNEEYGDYDLMWIDVDSIYYLAKALNDRQRYNGRRAGRNKYFRHFDPDVVAYAIILGLEAVGSVERKNQSISPEQAMWTRIKDGMYNSGNAKLRLNKSVRVRVIVDSVSQLFIGNWGHAGRVLIDFKLRLESPLHTYLLTSNISKGTDEEMGAQVGHIVDGRIKLWNEVRGEESRVRGLITKMRFTNHSRRIHSVTIEGTDYKKIVWR